MITYQVDENTDSKKFVESCRKEGLVNVRRFPKALKGAKDPVVLQQVLLSGRTLLTNDREIHFSHLSHIPDNHCGILIIARVASPTTIRLTDVMRTLSVFKSQFPQWHDTSLRNSVVEITETFVQVWRIRGGCVTSSCTIQFSQNDWQPTLTKVLKDNASGKLISNDV